jgi:hypothetical protein
MLELLVPCGGMSELQAAKEVTSVNSKGGFLTNSEYLPHHQKLLRNYNVEFTGKYNQYFDT